MPSIALALLLPTQAPAAEEHQHQALGRVHFPVTCSPEAQDEFDQAMKLQHSFWYQAAGVAFKRVLERDPSCVMAYWGQALTLLYNPFTVPPAKNLAEGKALLQQAQTMGAKSSREADYIAALALVFKDSDPAGHRARLLEYEKAMRQLHARYPEDPEAAIYYALALNVAASPADKTYARQIEAAKILEAEWQRQPEHPGIAHYLVHTYDYPPLAEKGLAAAQRYAEIAPDSPHALHMPSHIFTRLGHWEQSVQSNRRSAEAARRAGVTDDELHAYDYMVYAYLQMGQIGAAKQVVDDLPRFADLTSIRLAGPFALAAIPARFVTERAAWADAASLTVRETTYPQTQAVTYFARAVGLARSGKPDEAAADVEALRSIVESLRGKDAYWMEQVDIQRQAAEGWVVYANGQREQAVDMLRGAADREGKTEKHVVTPGPLAPAREQLAEMLMERGRPADALREFEAVQVTEPNRFRAIYGSARAAEMTGNRDTAKRYYTRLVEIAAQADTARPELESAKSYLANN
jgi:hypothetical protein